MSTWIYAVSECDGVYLLYGIWGVHTMLMLMRILKLPTESLSGASPHKTVFLLEGSSAARQRRSIQQDTEVVIDPTKLSKSNRKVKKQPSICLYNLSTNASRINTVLNRSPEDIADAYTFLHMKYVVVRIISAHLQVGYAD